MADEKMVYTEYTTRTGATESEVYTAKEAAEAICEWRFKAEKAEAENAKLREEAVTLAGRVEELSAAVLENCPTHFGNTQDDCEDHTYDKGPGSGYRDIACGLTKNQAAGLAKAPTSHLQLVRAAMELAEADVEDHDLRFNTQIIIGLNHRLGTADMRKRKALDAYRKAKEECSK